MNSQWWVVKGGGRGIAFSHLFTWGESEEAMVEAEWECDRQEEKERRRKREEKRRWMNSKRKGGKMEDIKMEVVVEK